MPTAPYPSSGAAATEATSVPWYRSEPQLRDGCALSSVVFGRALNSVWVMSRPESTMLIGTPGPGAAGVCGPPGPRRLGLVGAEGVEVPADVRRRERVSSGQVRLRLGAVGL